MGTRYIRPDPLLGAILPTGRYLSIPTSPVTQITLGSGASAISFFNHGTGTILYGASNIAVNSGNYLFVNGKVAFDQLQDGWIGYVIADSISAIMAITEYDT